jgi:hypothetical protein
MTFNTSSRTSYRLQTNINCRIRDPSYKTIYSFQRAPCRLSGTTFNGASVAANLTIFQYGHPATCTQTSEEGIKMFH